MAVKKVGTLIREARTAKKLSQEQLASGIDGLSGSDIGTRTLNPAKKGDAGGHFLSLSCTSRSSFFNR